MLSDPMTRTAAIAIALIGLGSLNFSSGAVLAGSVSMDDAASRDADIKAYVDLYGAAAAGNPMALDNLRVLARLYDTDTLVEAADAAFETHGILVYPPRPSETVDATIEDTAG